MLKRIGVLMMCVVLLMTGKASEVKGDELVLNALSACVIDASNNRVLYEKNGYEIRPMASTTKIMTCILALENTEMNKEVAFSSYAAKMPDVQMNAKEGEKYRMEDLLYALMLESYNDVAVAIAESVAGTTEEFAKMMNEKAYELGCNDTYFITPNGLDAVDDAGVHSTTAVDMARIGAYAIKNSEFVKITNTRNYSFAELEGKRTVTVNNKNTFLDKMEGAFGMKTGFTGNAGYCFVGALEKDGKVFVSVVLGSGWPPHKNYKWNDTISLMKYGVENYSMKKIYDKNTYIEELPVKNGVKSKVSVYTDREIKCLISDDDRVCVYYNIQTDITAPVVAGDVVGFVEIFINEELFTTISVKARESVNKITYFYYFKKIVKSFLN